MSGPISYKFAAIDGDASDIMAAVSQVNGLLADGQGSLARLQGAWTGTGAMSYEAVQQRWNQNSEELNISLQNLAQAVVNANETMKTTEGGVEQMFQI